MHLTEEQTNRLLDVILPKHASNESTARQDDDMPVDFPSNNKDKAFCAEYDLQGMLTRLTPALRRLSRLNILLAIGERVEGHDKLPDIITYNETRMVLELLVKAKRDMDSAYALLLEIMDDTKGARGDVQNGNNT